MIIFSGFCYSSITNASVKVYWALKKKARLSCKALYQAGNGSSEKCLQQWTSWPCQQPPFLNVSLLPDGISCELWFTKGIWWQTFCIFPKCLHLAPKKCVKCIPSPLTLDGSLLCWAVFLPWKTKHTVVKSNTCTNTHVLIEETGRFLQWQLLKPALQTKANTTSQWKH